MTTTTRTPPSVDLQIVDARLQHPDYRPRRATPGSAGYDLRACIGQSLTLFPGEEARIPLGIALHLKDTGLTALLVPRSGLGANHGIVLGNLVGVIDADFTYPISAAVWNRADRPYTLQPLDRICQLLFVPVVHPEFQWVTALAATERTGGFGHSGSG